MTEEEIKKVSLEFAMQLMKEGRFGICTINHLIDIAVEFQYYFSNSRPLPTLFEESEKD